jgi:C-5 cytosine-specific DNA methylase
MGWENVFHCEINEFGQKILKYYWPKAISYADITKTDFSIHRGTIDILTGGFPCQPYSAAGKRLGKEDDRHLWPEMRRAIREIQPTWVVGENVRGLTNWNGGMVFDEVQAKSHRFYFQLAPLTHPIEEIGFGLLPTPTKSCSMPLSPKTAKIKLTDSIRPSGVKAGQSLNWSPDLGIQGLDSPSEKALNPRLLATMMGFPLDWTQRPFLKNG